MNPYLLSLILAAGPSLGAAESIKFTLETQLDSLKATQMYPLDYDRISKVNFKEKIGSENYLKNAALIKQNDNINQLVLEQILGEVESGVLFDFGQSIAQKKFNDTQLLLKKSDQILSTDFSNLINPDFQNIDGINFALASKSKLSAKKISTKKLISSLQEYTKDFSNIEFSQAKIEKIEQTDIITKDSLSLKAEVSIDIRGSNSKKLPIQKRSTQVITFERTSTSAPWKISAIELNSHEHLVQTRKPAFNRPNQNLGFDSAKTYPRLEALRRGGYAFAVEDINNDGHLDAFVGNYGPSTLWLGSESGEFKQVESPEVNKITLAKAAAFVDFDNDGQKDLLVTRFASDSFTGDVHIFKGNNGKFEEVGGAFPSEILREYAMPLAIADYNNDGLLDVYIGFPGEKDFSMSAYDPSSENNSKLVHGIFLNQGQLKFRDSTVDSVPKKILTRLYPHGSVATDFDKDGKVDIVIMDDQLNLSPILRNTGEGKFSQVNQEINIRNLGYGMGVASGDLDNDGHPEILMSNATFTSQQRLQAEYQNAKKRRALTSANLGIRFFKNLGDGTFIDRTLTSGLTDTGDGAGGVTLIDYDNDGLQDIYLVNGLWSGSSKRHNIDSLFAQAQHANLTSLNHMKNGVGERKRGETQSTYMKMLIEERIKEDGKEASLSFGGHQANRLYKNLGNGKFLEIGHMEGVGTLSDGYMSVVADVNRDGRPDLILRNCDVGSELAPFPVLEAFVNTHKNEKSLWLSFEGTTSNHMGVGTKVTVEVDGQKYYREVFANNSAAQGEVAAHIGLGHSKTADQVTVTWPSGHSETFKNLAAGRHHIKEGGPNVAQN